jgi:hypothetical protein
MTAARLKLQYLAVSDVKPDPRNPRKHSRTQIRAIAKSIESFGFNAPILVDRQHQVVAGHGRLEASQRQRLQVERAASLTAVQFSQSQILAIDQLLQRYDLLSGRYSSDLKRLDFIAEGSHFLGQLQEARCPLCDQPLEGEHKQHVDGHADAKVIYESSKAEASKIHGLSADLGEAIKSLRERRAARFAEQTAAQASLDEIDQRVDRELAPALLAIHRGFNRAVDPEALKQPVDIHLPLPLQPGPAVQIQILVF